MMKIVFKIIVLLVLFKILRIIWGNILAKRNSEKVKEMAMELDSKGIHNYTAGFRSYGELIDYYKINFAKDYLVAESFAYVVLKHELSPYRSEVKMRNQDKRMQTCHRIMLDYVVGTPYEKCLRGNFTYMEYCMNLGILYTKYAMKNMNSKMSKMICDINFIGTPFPLAFIKICNEVYGTNLGI